MSRIVDDDDDAAILSPSAEIFLTHGGGRHTTLRTRNTLLVEMFKKSSTNYKSH